MWTQTQNYFGFKEFSVCVQVIFYIDFKHCSIVKHLNVTTPGDIGKISTVGQNS